MPLRTWYDERVLPRLVDLAMSGDSTTSWRQQTCAHVEGEVVELGFASGMNLKHYPTAVTSVLAVEPADLAWDRAAERVRAVADRGIDVRRVSRDAADLSALADHSVNAVVSTWTLCTIADLPTALAEVRRVLAPGAALHFVEHTISPTPWLAALGRKVQPAWRVCAGGCHLDRDILALLAEAGLTVAVGRTHGWFVAGQATPLP